MLSLRQTTNIQVTGVKTQIVPSVLALIYCARQVNPGALVIFSMECNAFGFCKWLEVPTSVTGSDVCCICSHFFEAHSCSRVSAMLYKWLLCFDNENGTFSPF